MRKVFTLFILMLIAFSSAESAKTYGWKRLLPHATFDVAVNPYNFNTIYVGGYSRAIYKSTDGGDTWATKYMVSPAARAKINNMLCSHLDTNVIIAGGIQVGDLFKSANSGEDWKVVSKNIPNVYLNGKALFEDSENPGHFYFGNFESGIIFESTDNGETWDSISIVMKPTKLQKPDGTIIDTLIRQQPTAIGIRPDSSNVILAGNQGGAIMVSQDRGRTWTFNGSRLATGKPAYEPDDVEVTMFYFNDINPRKVYAVITYVFPHNTPNGGLWRSDDGGYNWQLAAFPDTSFWGVACKTLANGEEEIFVGGYRADPDGVDSVSVPGNKIVRGSFDSGKTWWVFDNDIAWVDPYIVIKSIKTYGNTSYIVGEKGYLSRANSHSLLWQPMGFFKDHININDVQQLSPDATLVVADNGNIFTNYKSEFEWDSLQTNTSNHLRSITDFGNDEYCIVGDNGTVLTGSLSNIYRWQLQNTSISNNLYSVTNTSDKLYAVGSNGQLITSDNKGVTWQSRILSNHELRSIDFADNNLGLIVGAAGTMFRTNNGGLDWSPINTGVVDSLFTVKMYDNNTAVAAGEKGTILVSKDGGLNWTKQPSPIRQNFYSSSFCTADTFQVVGSSESVVQTRNAGEVWDVNYSRFGPVANVWSLRYFGPQGNQKLYMATEAGFFVLEDFTTSIEEIISADPTANLNIVLNENTLTVAYRRAYSGDRNLLKMRIVDMNGVVVFQKEYKDYLFENILDNITLNNLPSGAYLVEYLERDVKSVKKFIIK